MVEFDDQVMIQPPCGHMVCRSCFCCPQNPPGVYVLCVICNQEMRPIKCVSKLWISVGWTGSLKNDYIPIDKYMRVHELKKIYRSLMGMPLSGTYLSFIHEGIKLDDDDKYLHQYYVVYRSHIYSVW